MVITFVPRRIGRHILYRWNRLDKIHKMVISLDRIGAKLIKLCLLKSFGQNLRNLPNKNIITFY